MDPVLQKLIDIAEEFSGEELVTPDMSVASDLGITGGDAVEFYEQIERFFSIEIRPITETIKSGRKFFFWRLRDKTIGTDPTLGSIAAFIESSKDSRR